MASRVGHPDNEPVREEPLPRRSFAPVHYLVKIKSVTALLELETYESGVFEAGGHKWSLCLHPKGDENNKGSGWMSLYLSSEDELQGDTEVEVNYSFFVYDYNNKNYVIFKEKYKHLRTFSQAKTQWGLPKFLTLNTFKDPRNGYHRDERCQFGAEVLVSKPKRKRETFTIIKDPSPHTTTGKIQKWDWDFTENKNYLYSDLFAAGGSNWMLAVGPQVIQDRKWLSAYLFTQDPRPGIKTYAEAKLRLLNKNDPANFKERKVSGWMSAKISTCCQRTFMKWGDFEKGRFVKNKKLEFEVEILVISKVE